MNKLRTTFDNLIRKYVEAKDETLSTNLQNMYDGFLYDIDGFEAEFGEAEHDGNEDYAAELIGMLQEQVKAVRAMVAAYKKVSFTFG